jgi:hypothetical protein
MQKVLFLIACIILISYSYSFSEQLCSKSKESPPPSGAEELKIFESEFTIHRALNSVNFLENDVIEIIKKHEHKNYSILDFEGFYLGYPNHLMSVKGTLLKQNAFIAKQELEILKLKKGKNSEIAKAIEKFEDARKKLCGFLINNEYTD